MSDAEKKARAEFNRKSINYSAALYQQGDTWRVAYDLRDGTFWYTIIYSKSSLDLGTSSGPTLDRLREMDGVTFTEDLR